MATSIDVIAGLAIGIAAARRDIGVSARPRPAARQLADIAEFG
jgi:hypothetical protein